MKKLIIAIVVMLLGQLIVTAQDFQKPFETFTGKTPSYVYLEDGTELEGELIDLDRKKGLIKEVTIKDKTGKKIILKPEKIKYMYLPPNGLSKLVQVSERMDDITITKLENRSVIDDAKINAGYAYFEKSEVMIKKDKLVLLLQLVNPSFASRIKVFFDPYATETGGVSVMGVPVKSSDDKSYYVKKGDDVAFRLYKKDYDENYQKLFGDCSKFYNKNKKVGKWSDFSETIFNYTKDCTTDVETKK